MKVNEEGGKWINLFDTYEITVLNGNVKGDWKGHITHPGLSNQEEAVLDYGGTNTLALMEIESFTVDENASDHYPIVVSLMSNAMARDEEWVTVQK